MRASFGSVVFGAVAVVVVIGLMLGLGYMGTVSQATQLEASIIAQAQVCQQGIDTGFQQILGVAQVDAKFHEEMRRLFETIFSANDPTVQQDAVSNLGMFLVLGNLQAGTNAAQTSIELQRVIQATYANIASCQAEVAQKKATYSGVLGIPVGALPGQSGTWPNAWFASMAGLPRHLDPNGETAPHRDLDGDGVYTVFDYPSVVSIGGYDADAYNNGAVTPPPLYPTEQP